VHYLIDGYNLLFKTAWSYLHGDLEAARRRLMLELDSDARLLNLSITIVFDAPFQSDALSRGHFNSLEIIFTAKGQTADQYLVEWVQDFLPSKEVCVITSDKTLKRHIRSLDVKVEPVHEFLAKLHKRKLNKERRKNSSSIPIQKLEVKKAPVLMVTVPMSDPVVRKKGNTKEVLPPLSDLDAWEALFIQSASTPDQKF
jgi:uncharacterized protein